MGTYEDENGWTEDEVLAAVADEYAVDPAGMTTRLIDAAVTDQMQHLAPAIGEVLSAHRAKLWEANSAEALAAMDEAHPGWREYKDAVAEKLGEPGWLPDEVAVDAQAMAERVQAAYRAVKPAVDAERQKDEWSRVNDDRFLSYAARRARDEARRAS